jgi:hypothetical protein
MTIVSSQPRLRYRQQVAGETPNSVMNLSSDTGGIASSGTASDGVFMFFIA